MASAQPLRASLAGLGRGLGVGLATLHTTLHEAAAAASSAAAGCRVASGSLCSTSQPASALATRGFGQRRYATAPGSSPPPPPGSASSTASTAPRASSASSSTSSGETAGGPPSGPPIPAAAGAAAGMAGPPLPGSGPTPTGAQAHHDNCTCTHGRVVPCPVTHLPLPTAQLLICVAVHSANAALSLSLKKQQLFMHNIGCHQATCKFHQRK